MVEEEQDVPARSINVGAAWSTGQSAAIGRIMARTLREFRRWPCPGSNRPFPPLLPTYESPAFGLVLLTRGLALVGVTV